MYNKLWLIAVGFLFSFQANAQTLAEANKCYDEKRYDCAVTKYQEALQNKSYQEKDLATIQFRVGYGLSQQKRYAEAVRYLQSAINNSPTWGTPVWELAYTYYLLDSFKLAADYYQKTVPFYKDDKESLIRIYYWKGRSRMKSNMLDSALVEYKRAWAIDSTLDYLNAAAGDVSYDQRLYSDAARYYEKSIKYAKAEEVKKETLGVRYYFYGQALARIQRRQEAHDAYLKSIELGYDVPRVQWGIAGNYFEQLKYKEAVEWYNKCITGYKDDTASLKSLYYWRSRSYLGLKDEAKALADLDRSLAIDPNYFTGLKEKAMLLKNQKKYREAIPLFEKLITRSASYKNDLADFHYERGKCYLQLKDSVRAKSDFLMSVEYDPYLPEANVELGHFAFAKMEWASARGFYMDNIDEFYDDNQQVSLAYFRYGFSAFMLGSSYYTTAKNAFQTSIVHDSLNKEAHRYLADALYGLKDWKKAEDELSTCIRLYAKQKDSLSMMYKYRGMARAQQKNYTGAFSDYEQADKLKAFKEVGDVKYLGQLAYEIKEYNKAITIFTRMEQMLTDTQKSDKLFVNYARGRCYFDQKKKANAVADLKKALEYEPNNQEVKSWLSKAEALP